MLIRSGVKFGDTPLVDTMMKDGLLDAFHDYHMGNTAENVVKQYGISREEQDQFATVSQNKIEACQKNGSFKNEIVPVTVKTRKGAQSFINQSMTIIIIGFIYPFIHFFIHPSIHPYIHSSIFSSIHLSIHPFIHLFYYYNYLFLTSRAIVGAFS